MWTLLSSFEQPTVKYKKGLLWYFEISFLHIQDFFIESSSQNHRTQPWGSDALYDWALSQILQVLHSICYLESVLFSHYCRIKYSQCDSFHSFCVDSLAQTSVDSSSKPFSGGDTRMKNWRQSRILNYKQIPNYMMKTPWTKS